jgi:hypothetical protein
VHHPRPLRVVGAPRHVRLAQTLRARSQSSGSQTLYTQVLQHGPDITPPFHTRHEARIAKLETRNKHECSKARNLS